MRGCRRHYSTVMRNAWANSGNRKVQNFCVVRAAEFRLRYVISYCQLWCIDQRHLETIRYIQPAAPRSSAILGAACSNASAVLFFLRPVLSLLDRSAPGVAARAHQHQDAGEKEVDAMDAALGLLGLGSPCVITLEFDGPPDRPYVSQTIPTSAHDQASDQLRHSGGTLSTLDDANAKPPTGALPLFSETETVGGRVTIAVDDGKSVQHRGIMVEFVGVIEMLYDRDRSQEFTSLVRHLDDPGMLSGTRQHVFAFTNVEKAYDTYAGINVRLRYFLRVTIQRAQYTPDIVKEFDMAVRHYSSAPDANTPIRMEVGIEDALHIEFEYNKSKFHLQDVVIGKIYFLLVRIRVKRMEVEIRKRESAGSGANVYNETDTLMKFEVMDGAPVRAESIPVRMFLSGCPMLTPTYRSVNNKFSVKYYLNLVLVDEDDRRYFKQSEITLYRQGREG
jgi:vacuolar protein sorting-associated protein 26